MKPTLLTNLAIRLYPLRWSLLAAALTGIATVWVAIFMFVMSGELSLHTLIGVSVPPIFITWAALCCAFWFHPTHGFLRSDAKLNEKLPAPVVSGVRWYAAIFLCLFVAVSVFFPAWMLTSF